MNKKITKKKRTKKEKYKKRKEEKYKKRKEEMSFFNRIRSKNAVDLTVNVIQEVMSQVVSNCSTKIINSNVIRVKGTLIGNKIRQVIEVQVEGKCLHDSFLSISQQQELEEKLRQSARSALSGFHIGSVSETENVVSQYVKEVMQISNTSILECVVDLVNQNVLEIDETAIVKGNSFYQEIATTIVQSCVQKQVQQSKQVQNLQLMIDQVASSTGDNTFSLFFLVLLLFGLFFFFQRKKVDNNRDNRYNININSNGLNYLLILIILIILMVLFGWTYALLFHPSTSMVYVQSISPLSPLSPSSSSSLSSFLTHFKKEEKVEIMTLKEAQKECASHWNYYGFVYSYSKYLKKGKVQFKTYTDIFFPKNTILSPKLPTTAEEIPVFTHDRPPKEEIDRGHDGSIFLEFQQGQKGQKVVIWIWNFGEWKKMNTFVLPMNVGNSELGKGVYLSRTYEELMTKNYPPKGHVVWIDLSQYPQISFFQPNYNETAFKVIYTTNIEPYYSCEFQYTKENEIDDKGCLLYIGTKSTSYFIQWTLLFLFYLFFLFYIFYLFHLWILWILSRKFSPQKQKQKQKQEKEKKTKEIQKIVKL